MADMKSNPAAATAAAEPDLTDPKAADWPGGSLDTLTGPSGATPQDSRSVKEQVRRYYQATTEDYLKYYETDWHHHMHFGFDRGLPKGGNPTEHLVRYLAGLAGLLPAPAQGDSAQGDPAQGGREPGTGNLPVPQVLDAGCGVGGSAIWLARQAGCRCVGITLVEAQARLARGFAAAGGVPPRETPLPCARFAVNDFTLPAFKPGSFDVVWAVESFDHAPDKAAWVRSMASLLKPGGRLVIADGFRSEKPLDAAQQRAYGSFLAGWAVPHLCGFRELEAWAAAAGLEKVHAEDITQDVLPHSLAIFRFGLLFIPGRWLLRKLGLTSDEKLGNAYATYYQYLTLRRGYWRYGAFCFRKPRDP